MTSPLYQSSSSLISTVARRACCLQSALTAFAASIQPASRSFSTTPARLDWIIPKNGESSPSRKGRCSVPTGGSTRGTTLVWGDYGLRLLDHDRRVSAMQLRIADETIKRRLRGMKYRVYHRVSASIGVYTSGNDQRMGKGKGSFDHWTARVPVSRIVFELKGDVHEQVVRDAMRLAGNKLPGQWEFVKKGDPPVVGVTKLDTAAGITEASLKRARKPMPAPSLDSTANRLPSTTRP